MSRGNFQKPLLICAVLTLVLFVAFAFLGFGWWYVSNDMHLSNDEIRFQELLRASQGGYITDRERREFLEPYDTLRPEEQDNVSDTSGSSDAGISPDPPGCGLRDGLRDSPPGPATRRTTPRVTGVVHQRGDRQRLMSAITSCPPAI